jgi:iron complex transport system permease protein
MQKGSFKKEVAFPLFLIGMLAAMMALILIAVGMGRYHISSLTVLKIFLSKIPFLPIAVTWPAQAESVIFTLRLPRILSALMVGSALSLSGAAYQGVFKNPLVAPDMLGVSSGACVGASIGILLNTNAIAIQAIALAGGLFGVFLATSITRAIRSRTMATLVLAGIIIRGLMDAILGLLKYLADPDTQLAAITHWQLGSLSSAVWRDIYAMGLPMLLAAAILLLLRWRVNILSLGESEAQSLGIDIGKTRSLVIVCATALTACAVCTSGTIGWVGLVIPHFGRMLSGPDNRKLLPLSIVLGASFLLFIDTLARVITSAELPLSILTGLVGAPFYFYLLFKQRMKLS